MEFPQAVRRANLRVAAAALAWLVGVMAFFFPAHPDWVVLAVAVTPLGIGVVHGAGFRRDVIAIVALIVAVVSFAAYLIEANVIGNGRAMAVPPPGAIIDAQTGDIATNVQRVTPQVAQIESGAIFRACNRSTEHPCRYDADQGPVRAEAGDLMEFGIRLHNGNDTSVPYARLTVEVWGGAGTIVERGKGGAVKERPDPMMARLDIEYHTGISSEGIEEDVQIELPNRRGYGALNYVPGSTVLRDRHHHEIARLPDGIMDNGIGLANIGSPSSCYFCDLRYTRLVFFEARINDGSG